MFVVAEQREDEMTSERRRATGKKLTAYGVVSTLLGASLWGVSGSCMQFLTTTGNMSPLVVTLLRVILGGALLLALAAFCHRDKLKALVSDRANIIPLVMFAIALYANQLCYAKAVQLTNAGTATVLQMTETAFVMIFVCVRGRTAPKRKELAGFVAAAIATLLIATQGDLTSLHVPPDGLAWGAAAGISAAAYVLVPKQTGLFEKYGSLPVLAVGMLLSTLVAFPNYFLQGGSLDALAASLGALDAMGWAVFLIGLTIAGTAVSFGLYFYGVSLVGPVAGTLLASIEPVSATVMSALFLGTTFTTFDIAGMVLMCLMVAYVSTDDEKRPVPENANP